MTVNEMLIFQERDNHLVIVGLIELSEFSGQRVDIWYYRDKVKKFSSLAFLRGV